MEVFIIKRKVIFAILTTTIISASLLGCTSRNSKKTVNEINSSVSSSSGNSRTQQSTSETKVNENIQETKTPNTVTKIEGRRKEFLERLDKIQKELDALPEKKDSDAGVTNAMKNYYGQSYERYDTALNEIYALLKKELSAEIMKDLKSKQIKWIEQKEAEAKKEESKYKGGTFEFVAGYISLYESTKKKCYELVNEYMTD